MRRSCHAPFALFAAVLTACAAAPLPPPSPSQTLTIVPPPRVASSSSADLGPPESPPPAHHATEIDPEIEARLVAAMTCPWSGGIFSGPRPCPEMEGWAKADDLFADGKADATLVTLLESPDLKIRLLATENLDHFGKAFRTDTALAGRVLTVVERERQKDGPLASLLGRTAATIDVDRTSVATRIEAILQGHPLELVRSYLAQSLPRYNPTSAAVRRMVQAAVHDPVAGVRSAAAGA